MPANKSGYSLWLSPSGPEEAVLSDLIVSLSARSSPPTLPFSPHATLYADSLIPAHYTLSDILSCTKGAVSSLLSRSAASGSSEGSHVTCRFERVEAGELFFQCVYIRLDKHGSENLLSLHRACREAFEMEKDPECESYFPHVSLVYGDLQHEAKEDIIADMREKDELKAAGREGKEEVAGYTEYTAKEILIVKTAGKSDEWKIAARVPLSQVDK